MGTLTYDSRLTVGFEDRLLAHLQLVIGAKLRRGESFYFSWRDDPSIGSGRSTIWMHPEIPLVMEYSGPPPTTINPLWIDGLMSMANAPGGLVVLPEPAPPDPPGSRRPGDR